MTFTGWPPLITELWEKPIRDHLHFTSNMCLGANRSPQEGQTGRQGIASKPLENPITSSSSILPSLTLKSTIPQDESASTWDLNAIAKKGRGNLWLSPASATKACGQMTRSRDTKEQRFRFLHSTSFNNPAIFWGIKDDSHTNSTSRSLWPSGGNRQECESPQNNVVNIMEVRDRLLAWVLHLLTAGDWI